MIRRLSISITLALMCCSGLLAQQRANSPRPQRSKNQLPVVEGRYYRIHSALPPERIREADLRMSKMAEEYHARTKDFSGAIRFKFPFYLFATEEEYRAGGGLPGTAGCFDPNSNVLMAFDAGDAELWHTVQHEGFHQFASAVIGGQLPIWVNEGLADYFGEALFTGDSFIIGVVPEWRRARIVKSLAAAEGDKAFKPLEALLRMQHSEWNAEMSLVNYDQSWSLVHFLVHADDGKYQKPFSAFIRAISAGRPWERAWQDTIGNAAGLETRWRDFWERMPENPSDALYAEAATRAMTNFLARAVSQRQSFADFNDFARSAVKGEVQTGTREWLPQSVLLTALQQTARLNKNGYRFTLGVAAAGGGGNSRLPEITCTAPGGESHVGRFTLRSGRVSDVSVVERHATGATAAQNATVPRRER